MSSKVKEVVDSAVDALEKCSSPATRAGNSIERVGKLDARGVPRKVIVTLLTERTGEEWTEAEVGTISKVYRASQRRVLVTASQATALLEDATLDEQGDFGDNAVANPA